MTARRLLALSFVAALAFGACLFRPDWSRYPPCGEDGACPEGTRCWPAEQVCLPACEGGFCPDAGVDEDAGVDAGEPDGGEPDAGDGGEVEPDAGEEGDGGEPDAGPLRFDQVALLPAVELEPYLHAFAPRGGKPPYGISLVGGSLPPGLGLDGGSLEGTPEEPGSWAFTLRATDSAQPPATDDAQFSLQAVALLRIGSQFDLTDAHSGHPYSEKLYATGGSGAGLSWSISQGALPGGISLDGASGIFSGNTSAATSQFEVTLVDSGLAGQVRKKLLKIVVLPLTVTLHIRTKSLPHGRVGTAYDYDLVPGGGTPAYSWTITGGGLPDGLSLVGTKIVGNPTVPGDYTVTLRLADSLLQSTTRTFTFTVH